MNFIKTAPMLSGLIIALMVTINTSLSRAVGDSYSVFLIHLTGLTALIIWGALRGRPVLFKREIPLWIYLGGGLGIFIVLFNNITIQSIGVSLALSLGIAGQILTSALLEHTGFMGMIQNRFTLTRLPGIILVLAGSILIVI